MLKAAGLFSKRGSFEKVFFCCKNIRGIVYKKISNGKSDYTFVSCPVGYVKLRECDLFSRKWIILYFVKRFKWLLIYFSGEIVPLLASKMKIIGIIVNPDFLILHLWETNILHFYSKNPRLCYCSECVSIIALTWSTWPLTQPVLDPFRLLLLFYPCVFIIFVT